MSDTDTCRGCGAEHYAEDLDESELCRVCRDREAKLDPHPSQQIRWDGKGVIRFRDNRIVRRLLDTHPTLDLHELTGMDFSQEDWMQFAQLIGYSVSGFGDLNYAAVRVVGPADEIAHAMAVEGAPESTPEVDRG